MVGVVLGGGVCVDAHAPCTVIHEPRAHCQFSTRPLRIVMPSQPGVWTLQSPPSKPTLDANTARSPHHPSGWVTGTVIPHYPSTQPPINGSRLTKHKFCPRVAPSPNRLPIPASSLTTPPPSIHSKSSRHRKCPPRAGRFTPVDTRTCMNGPFQQCPPEAEAAPCGRQGAQARRESVCIAPAILLS